MSLIVVASLLLSTSPMQRLTNACIAEGEPRSECICYAKFIEKNTSKRELEALATLVEPENRESLEQAFGALMKAGLTPTEIFDIGVRVESLTDAATKSCRGK